MKKLITVLVLAGAMIAPLCLNNAVSANSYNKNTSDCSVKIKGTTNDAGKTSSRFVDLHDGYVSTAIVVSGKKDCVKDVSIASWRAPYGSHSTLPIKDQTLYASKSYHLKVGTHILTIAVADCMYQVDMLYGNSPTYHGTAGYPSDMKLGWIVSGEGVCVKPAPKHTTTTTVKEITPVTPTPTPTPVVDTPVVPVANVTPTSTKPAELPATGATSTIAIFGLATVAGTLGYRAFLRRRQTV